MAGIIKADKFVQETAERSLERVSLRAEQLLQSARRQAEQLLADAHRDADGIRERAASEGRALGEDAARKAARDDLDVELKTALPALEDVIRHLAESGESWRRAREETVIRLARRIAEHVIRRELREEPQITTEWVREALQLVAGNPRIRIRLNPRDHALLLPYILPLADQLAGSGVTEIVEDPQVEPAGCLVQTEFGEVDQQLRTQLDRIEDELAG